MNIRKFLSRATACSLAVFMSASGLQSFGGNSVSAETASIVYHGQIRYNKSEVGSFDVNGRPAMCLEHAKTTPEGGTVTKTIYNDANVRKLLYYGYGGADSSYWGNDAGTTKARVITTLALDTAYGSRKGHKNSNAFYKWATAKPDPGIRGLYFSSTSLSTQRSDTAQWTNATTVMGTDGLTGTVDSGNDNVVVHNETTGKAGRSVSVKKGDSIYLSASPHYTGTVNLSGLDIAHAGTYQAIVWVTESTSHQDLGQLGYVSAPSVTTSLYAKFVGYNKDVTSDKIGDDIDSRIDGSVLELVDESGKVVDRWTSDSKNPHSLPELLVGGKYTIREVSAPEGYLVTDPVTFVVGSEKQLIALKDKREEIKIATHARDGERTSSHRGTISKSATLTDQVDYTNLIRGRDYTVKGKLHLKNADGTDGGVLLDPNGKEITAETSWKATERNGSAKLTYKFDSTQLQGKTAVVFEEMYENGRLVASHADISDSEQEIYFPDAHTNASSEGTESLEEKPDVDIIDRVTYVNLEPGKKYTVTGRLMDKATGKPFKGKDGKDVTATKEFTPDQRNGEVTMTFTVPASLLKGKTLVTFEKIYEENREVVAHEDISDSKQTTKYPDITTVASYDDTKPYDVKGKTDIRDTISYFNLHPGTKYTLQGVLMDKETGKQFTDRSGNPVSVTKEFTPAQENGTVDVTFTVDSVLVNGKTFVAYERLYNGSRLVKRHEDINDNAQTVVFPGVATKANTDMDKSYDSKGKRTIYDTVTYKNLNTSKVYTMTGTLYDKKTGKPLIGADGKPVTSSQKFHPVESSGTVKIEFTVDASILKGKTTVAFENLYRDNLLIMAHADINDEGQTNEFPDITTAASYDEKKDYDENGTTAITDRIDYVNFTPGTEYIIRGTLMDKETGKTFTDSDGRKVTVEKKFTPGQKNGSVTVDFTAHSKALKGKTVVAFEDVFRKIDRGEILVATHADINDAGQTVKFPEIRTTARYDESKNYDEKGTTVIADKVAYRNLHKGVQYVMKGTLYDKETGKPFAGADGKPVTAEKAFTPEGETGTVEIQFSVPSRLLKGRTTVAFERLHRDGITVTTHEDINDAGQTTEFPDAHTKASRDESLDYDDAGTTVITDMVTYRNLKPGKKYTAKGTLYDKATGQPFRDAKGNAFVSSKEFTPDKKDGSVPVTFSVPSRLLKGKTIVAFEDIIRDKVLVVYHQDLNDEEQTIAFPDIGTTASYDESKDFTDEGTTEIKDVVTYRNLKPGTEYVMKGSLMNKETSLPFLDENGKTVTAETKFTPSAKDGSVTVTFRARNSLLKGRTVVAYERLYRGKTTVVYHQDINDGGQTVRFPDAHTNATYDENVPYEADKPRTIVDRVTYKNLHPGTTYTLHGTLYDKSTGKPMKDEKGNDITATKEFTPSKADGEEEISFTVMASLLDGKTTVAFEDIRNGKVLVVTHSDINDEDQTLRFPGIGTTAFYDEKKDYDEKGVTDITDIVKYTNLKPGTKYTLKGTLMDKETGKAFLDENGNEVTGERTFTPKESNGYTEVIFEVSTKLLRGKTTVAFEKLYREDLLVTAHEDIEDIGQTIEFPDAKTNASYDETKNYDEKGTTAITDKVTYKNLHPGKEYTVKGTLMNKETGMPLVGKDGKSITAEKTFTPEEKDGEVDIVFTVDSVILSGKTTVAFERIYRDGILVITHEDIEDEEQTSRFPGIKTTATSEDKKSIDVSHKTVITDKVAYKNLKPGKEYTLKAALMNKATGKPVTDKDGKEITSEKTFTPEKADGSEEVTFEFDSYHLGAGADVVAFEKLYQGEQLVATHTDISDGDQTVNIRELLTDICVIKKDAKTGEKITGKDFEFTLYSDEEGRKKLSASSAGRDSGTATFSKVRYGTYWIRETKAPEGYKISEKPVKVVVDQSLENVGKTYEVTVEDQPVEKPKVKTGDDTNIIGFVIAANIALMGAAYLLLTRKHKA